MNEIICQRIEALRQLMREERLAAFVFTGTDSHNSEYVAAHWKSREWISGFNGSAGTVAVTMRSAALWTDSRYFLAAEEQLQGTGIELMKLRIEGTPTVAEWLSAELADTPSPEVGVDGMCNSEAWVEALTAALRAGGGITLRTNLDPMERIWTNRPPMPCGKVELHPMKFAGKRTAEKIADIRRALREEHADGMLVAALDDIAWTLNMRGSDICCNPVFVSYLLISSSSATLYINKEKLTDEVSAYLEAEGVAVKDYNEVAKGLRDYFEYNILMDADEINHTLFHKVKCREVVRKPSPIPYLKAVKNATEIDGFRRSMHRDGIAMVKFLHWLEKDLDRNSHTELSVAARLEAFRAEQPLYKGLSFDTIAAYGEHGAIVHYEPTAATDAPLRPEGFLLLDSGAQYLDGTTDITRTIPLGKLTDEQCRVYTLVLKGHIRLELLRFPKGASGTQLDAVARADMWREGMNFLHGTGHGVGAYLCVHEGPHQIRMEYKPAPMLAGMTVTDEPGLYLPGRFGVRIENTLLVKPYRTTEFGEFLEFEPLTLCPISKAPIVPGMLLPDEVEWLDAYHKRVYEELAPELSGEEKEWLREATLPLYAGGL